MGMTADFQTHKYTHHLELPSTSHISFRRRQMHGKFRDILRFLKMLQEQQTCATTHETVQEEFYCLL